MNKRILTNEELRVVGGWDFIGGIDDYERDIAKAQDAKTSSYYQQKIRELFGEVIQTVKDEEELDGDMPDEIWETLDNRKAATITLRATIVSTKKSILDNLQELKEKYLGGE